MALVVAISNRDPRCAVAVSQGLRMGLYPTARAPWSPTLPTESWESKGAPYPDGHQAPPKK